ncbi:MAG TPA: glycosyltransferase family 9 protein [Bryobacteraceae bacterium]|nr:glycosyltransferase family 9 protein [Bryobacteraceae bacterium]
MASISDETVSLLRAGGRLESVDSLLALPAPELFGGVVEPLSDSFEPTLIPAYVDLFTRLVERSLPGYSARSLTERYARLRKSRPVMEPSRVVVLSRITLGADVALTSTFLGAALQRWPSAQVVFAGPAKNFEMFAGHPRLSLLDVKYRRHGTLASRLEASLALAPLVNDERTLVLDPDSRLSQLGLLPLAEVERTLFFESRGVGGESDSLVALTRGFVRETIGIDARPWIQPPALEGVPAADVAVSFGVGENPAKRMDDAFEFAVVQGLLDRGLRVLLDSGAPGTAEAERAALLEDRCQGSLIVWHGSFAPFAAAIGRSRLYVGYDSAGQHVAAAYGVPRLTVFHGHAGPRFAARWRPDGDGFSRVVFAGEDLLGEVWRGVDAALA